MSANVGTNANDVTPIAVLVVDDDPAVLSSWREILSDARYRLQVSSNPVEVADGLDDLDVDVAVLDIRMPELGGMELLGLIKEHRPEVEVVMMTGYGGVQDAVQAIRHGAYDFLSKPFESMQAAELSVRRAAEMRRLERRVHQLERQMDGQSVSRLIGQSPPVKRVVELIPSVAASPATVLVVGESGTGKELLARAIHENSPRAARPLVAVNCSALPDALLESELFGHVKGAFTGAVANHRGLFQAADGGTLFLDEVADMALSTQAKLLRVLQEGEVRPVGANHPLRVDVRVVAATNADFEEKLREGTFREDLYYRLNVIRVEMPPLRDRGDDIVLLAHHLLHKHQQAVGKRFDGIDSQAAKALMAYGWRGNVRELENVIERAVAISRGRTISVADLPPRVAGSRQRRSTGRWLSEDTAAEMARLPFNDAKAMAVGQFERDYLRRLLKTHPTVSAAARAAGLDRSNFRRLLRKHELLRPDRRTNG